MNSGALWVHRQHVIKRDDGAIPVFLALVRLTLCLQHPDRSRRRIVQLLHHRIGIAPVHPAGVIQNFWIVRKRLVQGQGGFHRFGVAIQVAVDAQKFQSAHPAHLGIGGLPEALVEEGQRREPSPAVPPQPVTLGPQRHFAPSPRSPSCNRAPITRAFPHVSTSCGEVYLHPKRSATLLERGGLEAPRRQRSECQFAAELNNACR